MVSKQLVDETGAARGFRSANAKDSVDGTGNSAVSQELVNNADAAAEFLSAIGNGKRLAIMCHLVGREMSVSEIAEKVKLSQSALSQHLAKLRSQGLVETRRQRQMIFYSCNSSQVRLLLSTLDGIFGGKPSE